MRYLFDILFLGNRKKAKIGLEISNKHNVKLDKPKRHDHKRVNEETISIIQVHFTFA